MPRPSCDTILLAINTTARHRQTLCAMDQSYNSSAELWNAVERNDLGAMGLFEFARRLRNNWNTRHTLRKLKGEPDSRAALHFKEELFNLYKLLRLRCKPQH